MEPAAATFNTSARVAAAPRPMFRSLAERRWGSALPSLLAVLLAAWLSGVLPWAEAGRRTWASSDPPPPPPAELAAAEAPAGPGEPLLDDGPRTASRRAPVPPPTPPLELFADRPALVIRAPAARDEPAGTLPASARVFAILQVEAGNLSDEPATAGGTTWSGLSEAGGNLSEQSAAAAARLRATVPGRVFEFAALPGTDESIDPTILQLPRVYRVAEVQLAPQAAAHRAGQASRPPVRTVSRRQPPPPVRAAAPAADPRDPMVAMGFKSISQVTTETRPPYNPELADELQHPPGEAADQFAQYGRFWDVPHLGDVALDPDLFLEAADFCHPPLYFEEINLERFGTSCAPRLQPVISGARFFVTVPALPYLMTVQRPGLCYYDGSPYRPGRPAPWHRELPPLQLNAATVEAAVLTGLIFAIP